MPENIMLASTQIGFPILSIIAYLPLAGLLFIAFFIRRDKVGLIKVVANVIVIADFLISLLLVPYFRRGTDLIQFVEWAPWIQSLGVSYYFGIDGISVLLVLLTTLLGVVAVLSSWTAITEREKEYYIFMLLLQTGMLGVFMALDFFMFYIFWEIMLVPMYFLIGVWGGGRKLYSAIKFFLYTLFGSVLMLLGILALYFIRHELTGQEYTFEILKYYNMNFAGYRFPHIHYWIFLAFFVGFAIKVPMFPFHTWLPDAHVDAPTAGSVILAGVLLKMGTYGFVRISLPILPEATWWFIGFAPDPIFHAYIPYGPILAIIGIIYGALVAMMQKDVKRLVAYASVSHLGFVMLGVFALNKQGIEGGILQMINHGLSTGALFLIVGLIYERRHTRMIEDFGGLSKIMPIYAAMFLIVTLSSIGLPGLNGFVGEIVILIGVFQVKKWWAVLAATGIVLGAAYMLWMFQRVMFGEIDKPENQGLTDLNWRERWTLIPIIVMCFWIGLYPKPFFDFMHESVEKTVAIVHSQRPEAAAPRTIEVGDEEGIAGEHGAAVPGHEGVPAEKAHGPAPEPEHRH